MRDSDLFSSFQYTGSTAGSTAANTTASSITSVDGTTVSISGTADSIRQHQYLQEYTLILRASHAEKTEYAPVPEEPYRVCLCPKCCTSVLVLLLPVALLLFLWSVASSLVADNGNTLVTRSFCQLGIDS